MKLAGDIKPGQVLKGSITKCDVLLISAYGIALKHGFKGTEEEWLRSLEANPERIQQFVVEYLEQNPTTVDTTLSNEGEAADAKAVGEAIAEAKRIAKEQDDAHANLKNNPHGVTAEQIGLGNVDDTSDMDKPVSNAQAAAIADAKKAGTDAQTMATNAKTDAANALISANAYTNEQVKKARPYNLLKNSNFADPVNTKGEASYKGAVESIDRWEMTVPQWMVSLEDACIKVSDNPDNSTTKVGMFRQTIAVPSNLRGKTVTFAAKLKGNGMTRLNINNTSIGDYTIKDANGVDYSNDVWHIRSLTGVVPDTGDTFYVALQSRNMETWYCEWVALYEGEYTAGNLPDYQPKGYMVEAMDCGANVFERFLTIPASSWYNIYGSVFQFDTTVKGLFGTDKVDVDVFMADHSTEAMENNMKIEEEFAKIFHIPYGDGTMWIRAREKPEVDIPIKIKVVR